MNFPLKRKYIRLIRKAIPYCATRIATFRRRNDKLLWKRWYSVFQQRVYTNSFLGKIKVLMRQDDILSLVRLFTTDDEPFDDIFERKVYDTCGAPKEGEIVIDVGAHIGLFTIYASRLVGPNGIVIAIEPHPDNFSILLSNIRLNHLQNVIPVNMAIADKEGTAKLFIDKKSTTGHSIIFHRSENFLEVRCTTLDFIVKRLGLTHVDFIKMDIEGAEYRALRGCKEILRSNNVRLSIEASHDEYTRKKCIKFLQRMGFATIERRIGEAYFLYASKKLP